MSTASVTYRNPDDFGNASEFRRFPGNSWAPAGVSASASPSGFPHRSVHTWESDAAASTNNHFDFDNEPSLAASAVGHSSGRPGFPRPPNASNSWAQSNDWVNRDDGVNNWESGAAASRNDRFDFDNGSNVASSAVGHAINSPRRPGLPRPPNASDPWGSATTPSNDWVNREDRVIGGSWQPADHDWQPAGGHGWRPAGAQGPSNVNPPNRWGSADPNVWGDWQPVWRPADGPPARPSLHGVSDDTDTGSDEADSHDTSYRIFDVTFDVGRGTIVDSAREDLSEQKLINHTDDEQEMEMTFSKSVTHTSSFEHSAGASITAGVKFDAGIPFVGGASSTIAVTGSYTHTWGEEFSTTQQWSARFPVKVGAFKTYRAISSVTKGLLSVPYTMRLWRPRGLGGESTTGDPLTVRGRWTGYSSWHLRHEVFDETDKLVKVF